MLMGYIMKNFFSLEGRFFETMDRFANLLWLNLLFVICCIPIVTIGASTTALYYVTLKMVKNEECYITKSFFNSFKNNFKQSTTIWMIAFVMGIIFVVDLRIMSQNDALIFKIITVIVFAMLFVYIFIMTYVFPVLSKFDNSVKNTIRNSFLISISKFPFTILLIFCIAVPFVLSYFITYLIPVILLIGASGIAYGTSFIYVKIFDNLIDEKDTKKDEN